MIWSSPPLRALTRPTPSLPRLHGARLTPPRTFMCEATAKAVACYPIKERGAGPARKYQRNIKDVTSGASGRTVRSERDSPVPLRRLAWRRADRAADAPIDVWRMIRRRAAAAGIDVEMCCHTFRATGLTNFLANGGTLENAQAMADHASPRTTQLYDRTGDEITLDEVERITI